MFVGPSERSAAVVRTLRRMYRSGARPGRDPRTNLDAVEGPFRVMIATLLSHRTRDEATHAACMSLFARHPTPASLASAPLSEIETLIRPVGFYRVKARRIRDVARTLIERHGGRVPEEFSELMALPGVGRKTANCVLVYGFGRDAIPVDTHVHRISNRLGIVRTTTPEETEGALTSLVPQDLWQDVNELMVVFGQRVCRPIGPRCRECPFTWCPSRRPG